MCVVKVHSDRRSYVYCMQDGQGSGWEVQYCSSSTGQTYVLWDLCSNVTVIISLYTGMQHGALVASSAQACKVWCAV